MNSLTTRMIYPKRPLDSEYSCVITPVTKPYKMKSVHWYLRYDMVETRIIKRNKNGRISRGKIHREFLNQEVKLGKPSGGRIISFEEFERLVRS